MREKGTIASWNDDKGYGFISPISGGRQVFVHISAFSNRGRRPEIGAVITYGVSTDKQGRPCAINATLAGDRLQVKKARSPGAIPITLAIVFIGVVTASVVSGRLPPIILAVYVGLSILTYAAYALDKSAAKKGAWRTQESTLHLLALAGGWPGALIAQQTLRHKSKKKSFRIVFWVTAALNLAGFVWLFSPSGAGLLRLLQKSVAGG